MTANHPSRRWHGCPLCKAHKSDTLGDIERRTIQEHVGVIRRWNRGDIPEDQDYIDPDSLEGWAMEQFEEREGFPPFPEPEEKWPSKRKNTKLYCKGKVGRAHVPEIRYEKGRDPNNKWHQCRFVSPYSLGLYPKGTKAPVWWCFHEWYCANCGKILNRYKNGWHGGVGKEACPTYRSRYHPLRQQALDSVTRRIGQQVAAARRAFKDDSNG